MILQQLEKDADRLADLPPSMYEERPVRWVLHLERDGRVHWPPERLSGGEGRRDPGKRLLVPFKRRSGTKGSAYLLADKRSFTWGIPASPEDALRAGEERGRYLELLDQCARETGDPDVSVVAEFLRQWDAAARPLPGDLAAEDLTTFAVGGEFLVARPEVQCFWASAAAGRPGDDEGAELSGESSGQCLVCGRRTTLARRLPTELKKLPGRPAGASIVSGDLKPAESYGRREAYTSCICARCGERFANAGNALIAGDKTHLHIGPVTYLFWARSETEFDVVGLLREARPDDVQALLRSALDGRPPLEGDDSEFFATSVSVYIARAVFRGWLRTSVGAARDHLARWFRLQRLVDWDGAAGPPLPIRRLTWSLYRLRRGVVPDDDIVARVPDLLVQVALSGGPLPDWFLAQAVRRCQAERAVTYPRAALIKAVLCSQRKEDSSAMERLDLSNRAPAYLCGRLLAELEAIQRVAIKPKATLVDRFYGTASSAPASVFGTLLRGSQPHLSKLRKERPGAYKALQERLEEIMADLHSWPRTLMLRDQALFALGYYHQRAEDRRAALEAKARKLSDADAPLELAEDTPETKEESNG